MLNPNQQIHLLSSWLGSDLVVFRPPGPQRDWEGLIRGAFEAGAISLAMGLWYLKALTDAGKCHEAMELLQGLYGDLYKSGQLDQIAAEFRDGSEAHDA